MNSMEMGFSKDMPMKLLVMTFSLCTILFTISACNNNEVSIGQEFSLSISQSVFITGENLEIRFVEVSEDSRCPKDVTCVWEGKVIALVEISAEGSSQQLKLMQPGLTEQYAMETYKDYQLTFNVKPYPEEGKEIAADKYQLLLIINR